MDDKNQFILNVIKKLDKINFLENICEILTFISKNINIIFYDTNISSEINSLWFKSVINDLCKNYKFVYKFSDYFRHTIITFEQTHERV